MPSSREDVYTDSMWNQWLREEIHHVFVDALQTFKVGCFLLNVVSMPASYLFS